MKILCVIDSLGSGGAQRQLVELGKGFKEKGQDVSFLVYHNINFFKEDLDIMNIPVTLVVEKYYLLRILKIRKEIRKLNPDVVLSFLEGANFICEMAGLPCRKWKLIVGERSSNPNILKSFKLKFFRWAHFFADAIVSNSFENIKMIQKVNPLISSDKCHVIYNIVNFENFNFEKNFTPRKNGKFQLLIASNHQYLKNAKNVVEGLNLLPQTYKNLLVIHWYGRKDSAEVVEPYKEAQLLVEKYNLVNQLKFFDPIPSINEIILNYDALGLFSLHEGLPNSICEGMASGKPIIATNVSDNKFLINHNKSGILVDGFEAKNIRDSLMKLLDLSDKKLLDMGKISYEIAQNLFKKEDLINEYLKLFKCLLNK